MRLIAVMPLHIKHTGPNLLSRAELSLPPGQTLLVRKFDGGIALAEGEPQEAGARISYDGSAVVLELLDSSLVGAVTVNNATVTGVRIEAQPFDVIAIGGERLELLQPDHEKIVCGNSECHLLNDLPYEENCKWCGYYLAASGSFTRVTLP